MTHPPISHRNGRRAALGMLAGVALLAGATPAKASAVPVRVPTPTGVWTGFDAWLGQRASAGEFSGTALVVRDGRVLLDAGYGLSDRASSVADTPQTRYCVASIGKLFTAVAVAQLVEQHRLSFTDPIGRYLTGFAPAVADGVTVGDLLDMTSGLGDVVLGRPDPPATLAGMMQLIEAEPLQSQPGSSFLYSNDGYIVLGALIEAVTGESYQRYVTEHVLAPSGMTHTSLTPYTPADVPGMAHGYALVASGVTTPPVWQDVSDVPEPANPSGGAYSTAGDLASFARALTDHRLLSPKMTATVLTPRVASPQPGGPPVDMYTYGFAYQALDGVTFVGHNGGTPGYGGQIDIYPQSGYVVVILTNQDDALVPAIQKSEALITGA